MTKMIHTPEKDENNDCNSTDTNPENPWLKTDDVNGDGAYDGILPDDSEPQGRNTHAKITTFNDEGVRHSTIDNTRRRRATFLAIGGQTY